MGRFIKKTLSTLLSMIMAFSSVATVTMEKVFAETIYEFSAPSNIIEGAEDVWDFGPTYIPEANNYISEVDINNMYPQSDQGSTEKYLTDSFSSGDIEHTLNTSNENVTRYSSNNKTNNIKAFDCTELDITGYINNAYGMGRFYMNLNQNDAVKFYVNEANIHMYSSDGTKIDNYSNMTYESGAVQTFIAEEAGTYYFDASYTSNIYKNYQKKW